jgi:hypothetical protein
MALQRPKLASLELSDASFQPMFDLLSAESSPAVRQRVAALMFATV